MRLKVHTEETRNDKNEEFRKFEKDKPKDSRTELIMVNEKKEN